MADIPPHTRRRTGSSRTLLDSYRIRIMLSLVVSLGLAVVLFRLPLTPPSLKVGWSHAASQEVISIDHIEERPVETGDRTGGALITRHESPQEDQPEAEESEGGQEETLTEEQDMGSAPIPISRLQGLMRTSDRSPIVKGGMGSLYMRIQYPEAARRDGIQGRVVVNFVVEEDGTTSNIEVIERLHPLTDSAAVRALRHTEFVPGRRDGEPVRVRMRLPIRFTLLDAPHEDTLPSSEGELANADNNSGSPD